MEVCSENNIGTDVTKCNQQSINCTQENMEKETLQVNISHTLSVKVDVKKHATVSYVY